jgi:hypothetical protein
MDRPEPGPQGTEHTTRKADSRQLVRRRRGNNRPGLRAERDPDDATLADRSRAEKDQQKKQIEQDPGGPA